MPVSAASLRLVVEAQTSSPDPAFADVDDETLEHDFRTLGADIAASTCRWLELLRELLVRGVWAHQGARTPWEWLSYTVSMGSSTAREHCRVALRLPDFPLVRERFRAGTISYSKVRAITRVHEPALEARLLDMADGATGAQLETIVSGLVSTVNRTVAAEAQVPAWDRSGIQVLDVDYELVELRIRLPRDEGYAALAAFEDAATRARTLARRTDGDDLRGIDVRRVEAFTDAAALLREREPDDASGTDRARLVIHADADQLVDTEPGEDRVELVEVVAGPSRRRAAMSARTLRRLACEAGYVVIGHDEEGREVGVSGTTRRVPSRLRRALLARDRGCRFPSCTRRVGLHAHHIVPVERDGPTEMGNLVLLCSYHHTFVHERDWRIHHDGHGHVRFAAPNAPPVPTVAPFGPASAEAGASAADRDARALRPPQAMGERVDYSDCVWVLMQELARLAPPEGLVAAA